MRKVLIFVLAVACVFCSASCSFTEWMIFPTAGEEELISEALELDVSGGKITHFENTHGGFHGDGYLYAEVSFENNDFREKIASAWKPLPLTENLKIVCYGGVDKDGYSCAPHIKDEDGNPRLPQIDSGFYYFKDRFNEYMTDRSDDSKLFDRGSVNYTLAIYNTDAKRLYVFEFDT